MRFIFKILLSICIFSTTSLAAYRGLQIMSEVDKQAKRYNTQKSEVFMLITDTKGATRKRYFTNVKKTLP